MTLLNVQSDDFGGKTWLISLFEASSAFRQAVEAVSTDQWRMAETKLEELVKPSREDEILKVNFWTLVEWATKTKKKNVHLNRIYSGIMMYDTFAKRFLQSPYRMAWLLKPITHYDLVLRATHARLQKQIMQMATVKVFDDKGELKHKEARLVLDVFKVLDERLHGQAVQRALIEKREIKEDRTGAINPKAVEAEISLLEQRLGSDPGIIDLVEDEGETV